LFVLVARDALERRPSRISILKVFLVLASFDLRSVTYRLVRIRKYLVNSIGVMVVLQQLLEQAPRVDINGFVGGGCYYTGHSNQDAVVGADGYDFGLSCAGRRLAYGETLRQRNVRTTSPRINMGQVHNLVKHLGLEGIAALFKEKILESRIAR